MHISKANAVTEAVRLCQQPPLVVPLILLFFCFVLGIIAVLAGVGGGGRTTRKRLLPFISTLFVVLAFL